MDIKKSIRRLTSMFIILFVALSGGLVYWQVVMAAPVVANSHNNRHCLFENSPLRGTIYDRNGQWLAKSVPDPKATCGYSRVYADPSLAGLIGYYAGPNYSATGVEKQYDKILNGDDTMSVLNNTINKVLHRPPFGNDIYLTIDVRIQHVVDQHFDDPTFVDNRSGFQSNKGSVVVMNPQTGEVLAMLSRPGFDPNKMVQTLQKNDLSYYNQLVADPAQPLLERPLQGRYIPGSTYKAVTLLADLNEGQTLDQPFDQQHAEGPISYNSHTIPREASNILGYTFHYPVTTAYGFAHSDNIIFAQIGVQLGEDKWLDYNKRFYVEGDIPFDLPVARSTVLPADGHKLSDIELASNAFGQGTDFVTPLQMSLFDNAVAADGKLMRPALLLKVVNHDKQPTQAFTPQILGNPISAQTAMQVRQAMYGVSYCGSGSLRNVGLNLSPWGIISKTGTAEMGDNTPAQGWLFTQAPYSIANPAQLPAVSIVATKEHAGEGGYATGPMITGIYNDIFSKGYVQIQQPPPLERNYCFTTGLLQ